MKGVVRHMSIGDDPVGRSVEEILRLVEAFKYTDKHGVMCPVGWRRGKKAIKVERDKTTTEEFCKDDGPKGPGCHCQACRIL